MAKPRQHTASLSLYVPGCNCNAARGISTMPSLNKFVKELALWATAKAICLILSIWDPISPCLSSRAPLLLALLDATLCGDLHALDGFGMRGGLWHHRHYSFMSRAFRYPAHILSDQRGRPFLQQNLRSSEPQKSTSKWFSSCPRSWLVMFVSPLNSTLGPNLAMERKVIQEVVEALRSVPSSANTQPWTIVVVQGEKRNQLAKKLLEQFDAWRCVFDFEGDFASIRLLIEAGVLAGDTLWMQVRWEQPSNLEGWTWRHQTWSELKDKPYEQLPKTMIPRMSKAVELFEKEYFEHLGISADQRSKFRSNFERGPQFSLHGVEEMFWSAPLHLAVCAPSGPCLKEDPPVDGVFLDMGSAITALSMCAHDRGLAVHCHWQLARFGSVYREVLGSDLPEDHFVVAGLSLGFPIGGRAVQTSPEFLPTRLTVDETTRDSVEASSHGLMHLVQSRHCSHTLETGRAVPKELLRDVLSAARNVFSIGGAQPWSVTVIQGAARDRLSEAMLAYFDAGNNGAQTYKKYSTQNTERMQKGKDMYGFELYEQRHGLQRDDAEGRRAKYRPNYQFWGAPVLLLLNAPKTSSAGTFIDVGSYMQLGVFDVYAILVAMHAYGLGGKPLGSVAKFTELCREVLGPEAMPEDGKWEESRDRWHHSELQLSSNSIH
ncbi:unnamed protein product [Durusdinium trenchii]|uniref:Nitroreductase domain-containing protein n=1 Tax=Durusdinium trenchii TaxID=1381693 RepID=A0ABP0QRJ0_9DINO